MTPSPSIIPGSLGKKVRWRASRLERSIRSSLLALLGPRLRQVYAQQPRMVQRIVSTGLRRIVSRQGATPRRFVIIAHGRSGSTLLVDLLRSHPEIVCYHEPFSQSSPHRPLDSQEATAALADEIFEIGIEGGPRTRGAPSLHRGNAGAVGFKMTASQLLTDVPGLLAWFERQEPMHIVLLDRRSTLRRFLSYQLARKRGRWHSTREEDATPSSIRVKPKSFRAFIKRNDELKAALGELLTRRRHQVLELDYESLVADRNATVDRAVRFLGLCPVDQYEAETVKLAEGRLEDLIKNYDEIDTSEG